MFLVVVVVVVVHKYSCVLLNIFTSSLDYHLSIFISSILSNLTHLYHLTSLIDTYMLPLASRLSPLTPHQQKPTTNDCNTPPNKLTNIAAGITHEFTLPKYTRITTIATIIDITN